MRSDHGEEVADLENYGTAKSLFAAAGGIDPGRGLDAAGLAELIEGVNGLDPAAFDSTVDRVHRQAAGLPTTFAPVRLPDAQRRLEVVRTTPMLQWVRGLAEDCAQPGLELTGTGNLRRDDALRLVMVLETGDDVEKLRSAADLPGLDRVLALALDAGAVRRHGGRLVAIARFSGLDDLAAHEEIVHAALSPQRHRPAFGLLDQVHRVLAEAQPILLAGLLHAGPEGLDDSDVAELFAGFVLDRLPGLAELGEHLLLHWTESVLDELDDLGMIETWSDDEPCADCDAEHWSVALSAAGVGPALDLLRALGVEVPLRPDPVGATAAELAELAGVGHPEDWQDDLCQWLDAQSDPAGAGRALLLAVAGAERGPIPVVLAITAVEESAELHAVEAVRALLGGPSDGIALSWLLDRDAVDPAQATPQRMLGALLDMLTFSLDAGGEEELVAAFEGDAGQDRGELLDEIWRSDHPRLGEILDVLGARLPDRATAKQARRSAIKLRTRLGQRATRS
jgi:hypothetical protein